MESKSSIFETRGNDTPLFVRGLTGGFKKNQPSIKIGSSRGTLDNPKICAKGDQIGVLKFTAYTGAEGESYANAGFVSAVVKEDITEGQKTVNADLILGCINGIYTGEYVSVNEKGVLNAKGITIENDQHRHEERDKTKPWWLSGGTKYDYPVPITIKTTSTGILISQTNNFKQPSMRFDSYDNNPLKAGWTAYNRFRGTPQNPKPLEKGDFIYAFDWLGKSTEEQPWEWGMAQTAVVDDDPQHGFMPTSMNWVTRSSPLSKPEVRVKISNNGMLTAYTGIRTDKIETINETLDLPLQEANSEDVENATELRYFKTKIKGENYIIPAYKSGCTPTS